MKRYLANLFLSDTLVLAFALAWLGLILMPLMISPDHTQGFEETNMVILSTEIGVCVFSIIWAVIRLRHNLMNRGK